jgi:uncharacterized membrane protein
MNFENPLYSTLILAGSLFIIFALILYIFPPKKINFLYGYRTSSSMKSQERWDFAQKKGAITMLQSGLGLFIVSFLGTCFAFSEKTNTFLSFVILMLAVLVLFIRTERAIKKKFDE